MSSVSSPASLSRRATVLRVALIGSVAFTACTSDGIDAGIEGNSASAIQADVERLEDRSQSDPLPPTTSSTSSTHPASTAATETSPTTTESLLDDEAAVLAAVDGYWESYLDANMVPDPNHPGLALYRTGTMLELEIANVQANVVAGLQVRAAAPSVFSVEILDHTIRTNSAEVVLCLVDDLVVSVVSTGEIVNDLISTSKIEFDLERTASGEWKVSYARTLDRWEGAAACV